MPDTYLKLLFLSLSLTIPALNVINCQTAFGVKYIALLMARTSIVKVTYNEEERREEKNVTN